MAAKYESMGTEKWKLITNQKKGKEVPVSWKVIKGKK